MSEVNEERKNHTSRVIKLPSLIVSILSAGKMPNTFLWGIPRFDDRLLNNSRLSETYSIMSLGLLIREPATIFPPRIKFLHDTIVILNA
jgi:hypothetical protein